MSRAFMMPAAVVHAPVLIILAPLLTAMLVSLVAVRSKRWARRLVPVGVAAHASAVVATIGGVVNSGGLRYAAGGWPAPFGIILVADQLVVPLLAVVVIGHAVFVVQAWVHESHAQLGFWVLTELLMAALSGILLAGDLFNLFVFIELASITSIGLVAHKRRAEGAGAGFLYLVYSSISGSLLLIAVALLYRAGGVLTIAALGERVGGMPAAAHMAAFTLVLSAFGIKVALVPLHFWQAPAYHAAGSSIAALFSAVAMNCYLYALLRILIHALRVPQLLPAAGPIVALCAAVSIVAGHTLGLAERDLKRLIAFSSVAHVGYVLLGVGVAIAEPEAPLAIAAAAAALLHLCMHSLMKGAAFLAARRLIDSARSSTIVRLRGVAAVRPVAFAAFLVAALALIGIPPTGGFLSKWRLAMAVYRWGGLGPLALIAVGTALSLWYYVRLFGIALDVPTAPLRPEARDTGTRVTLAIVATLTFLTVPAGWAGPLVDTVMVRAAEALLNVDAYARLALGGW